MFRKDSNPKVLNTVDAPCLSWFPSEHGLAGQQGAAFLFEEIKDDN
jgi:hypothetical protein